MGGKLYIQMLFKIREMASFGVSGCIRETGDLGRKLNRHGREVTEEISRRLRGRGRKDKNITGEIKGEKEFWKLSAKR